MKKQRSRRDNVKYPALDTKFNLKTRFEHIDFDYIDTLPEVWIDPKTGEKWTNERLKSYLNQFSKEYTNASFEDDPKQRIHKKKRVANPRNEDVLQIKEKLLKITKDINDIINSSVIRVKTKNDLRRIASKFKKSYKKILENAMTDIMDFYKTDAENRNNKRNSCILTRAKAQGKSMGIDDLPESYYSKTDIEDEIINKIDGLNLVEDLQESNDDTDDS